MAPRTSRCIKADDGEGYYFPDVVRFADGYEPAREAAWSMGGRFI